MMLSIFFPFSLLFTIQLISETLVEALRIPVPGAVVGALVLFCLLIRFKGLHQKIAPSCHTLIKNMLILYVPISVGLMDRTSELRENGAMLLTTLFVSTTVTALTTAWVFERASKAKVHE